MKFISKWIFVLLILVLIDHRAGYCYELFRPPMGKIRSAVSMVPLEYQKDVLYALRKSGRNAWELIKTIENVKSQEREGAAFLIANMPGRDLVSLKSDFVIKDIQLAYQVKDEAPWGKDILQAIFLNDVLPYANLNERRDNWREDFHQRFIQIAIGSKTIDQAVIKLNKYVFDTLNVSYNATKRPKPDQSPYESTQAHYASCTGLSILLADALRSVGIPARIVAIPMWADESGNHTWVEIWDGQWHYTGAAEPAALDHTWFSIKASQTDAEHPIFAASFRKTSLSFPMRWALALRFVPAEDVTQDYKH